MTTLTKSQVKGLETALAHFRSGNTEAARRIASSLLRAALKPSQVREILAWYHQAYNSCLPYFQKDAWADSTIEEQLATMNYREQNYNVDWAELSGRPVVVTS